MWLLERSRKDDDAAFELARAQYKAGEFDECLESLALLFDGPRAGDAHRLAGKIDDRRQKRTQAREHYSTALELHRRSGAHLEASKDAHALAGSYWLEEQHHAALTFLVEAHREAALAKDARMQGFVLMGVGDLTYEVGDTVSAERIYEEALKFLGDQPADLAWLRLKEGILHFESGRLEIGRARLENALELAKKSSTRDVERSSHIYLGILARDQERYDDAAQHFDRASVILDIAEDGLVRAFLVRSQATLERKRGRLDEAQQLIERAKRLSTPEHMNWRIIFEEGRIAEAKKDLQGAKLAYQRSIEKLEQLRARLAVDELRSWFLASTLNPYEALFELAAAEGDIEGALAVFERSTARTFIDAYFGDTGGASGQVDTSWVAPLERVEEFRRLLPRLGSSKLVAPRPVPDLLHATRGKLVLAYYPARDRLWIIVVNDGLATLTRAPQPYSAITKKIEDWSARPNDPALARELGSMLLPEELSRHNNSTVHLITSGALARVPFAALRDAKGRLFIERHVLTHVPSLTALAELDTWTRTSTGSSVVIADEHLPGSIEEAKIVAQILKTEATQGAAAIAQMQAARTAPVLHIATHASRSRRGPTLVLGDKSIDAAQILEWRLRPKLVVLASCSSGVGAGADVTQTLAGLFLAAGAGQVLATIRSIDDAATVQLIREFYAEGGASESAKALAIVQRRRARTEPASAWASFVSWGPVRF